jgi:hypothetical protein
LFRGNQKRRIFQNNHPGKAYQKQIEFAGDGTVFEERLGSMKINGVPKRHFYDIKKNKTMHTIGEA